MQPQTSTILVYMILNGKGRVTGCGLHGNSLVPALFLTGPPNRAGCFKGVVEFLSFSFFHYYVSSYYATHTDCHFEKFESTCILHYEVIFYTHYTIKHCSMKNIEAMYTHRARGKWGIQKNIRSHPVITRHFFCKGHEYL